MAGISRINSLILALIVVAMTASMVAEAQTLPRCAQKLVGCADSLNTTTTPPATCCEPLKEAITNELPCLCKLFNTPGLLKSFGINVTQALALPGRCGISGGVNECSGSPAPLAAAPPSAPTSDVGRTVSTGIFSSLLIIAAAMLY